MRLAHPSAGGASHGRRICAQPDEVVGNRDGTLACEPPPREPPPLPEGTFTDSCSGCALEAEGGAPVLRCEQCKGGDGRLHASMLPVGTCGADEVVANHDGALGCERRSGDLI